MWQVYALMARDIQAERVRAADADRRHHHAASERRAKKPRLLSRIVAGRTRG